MTARGSGSFWWLLLLSSALVACGDTRVGEADPVVARVDGEPVRLSEVESRAAWRLHRARLDVHFLIERETEQLIEQRLLERAAAAAGTDVPSLLAEAETGATPVDEEAIDRYLAEHPSEVALAEARPRIRYYLEETRRLERRLDLLARLRSMADVEVLLVPPDPPRSRIEISDAPARGAPDAALTIVHFADLSRADSARSARQLAELTRRYPGRLRLVHRSLPVERDELGLLTAQLAALAGTRGSFWALHDRLVAADGVENAGELAEIAEALDLPDPRAGLAGDPASLAHVRRDLDHARRAGVARAPTLFVNGRYFMGLGSSEDLHALVQQELAQ